MMLSLYVFPTGEDSVLSAWLWPMEGSGSLENDPSRQGTQTLKSCEPAHRSFPDCSYHFIRKKATTCPMITIQQQNYTYDTAHIAVLDPSGGDELLARLPRLWATQCAFFPRPFMR